MAIQIDKNEKGFYNVRVWSRNTDEFGKRKSKQKSNIRTIALAQKWAEQTEDQISNQDYTDLTFGELHELYLQSRGPKMSPTTIEGLKYITPRILAHFGRVKARDISTRIAQSFFDKLGQQENVRKKRK